MQIEKMIPPGGEEKPQYNTECLSIKISKSALYNVYFPFVL